MGLMLRFSLSGNPMLFDFQNLLHGHSHTASLGWAYQMLVLFMCFHFIPGRQKELVRLFAFMQFTVFGMIICFPLQGYGLFSIIFSSLHVVSSYVFIYLLLKHGRYRNDLEKMCSILSASMLAVTTAGIWAVAYSLKTYGKGSVPYLLSIQFYLHFLFNGFLIFALLAVLARYLGVIGENRKRLLAGTFIMAVSVPFGFALPVMWYIRSELLYFSYALSLALQFVSLAFIARPLAEEFRNSFRVLNALRAFILAGFVLKLLIQSALLIPELIPASFRIRDLYIGFIHLMMLGVVSGFILDFLYDQFDSLSGNRLLSFALWIFISGTIFTELILFLQGLTALLNIPPLVLYNQLLFAAGFLITCSALIFAYKFASCGNSKGFF